MLTLLLTMFRIMKMLEIWLKIIPILKVLVTMLKIILKQFYFVENVENHNNFYNFVDNFQNYENFGRPLYLKVIYFLSVRKIAISSVLIEIVDAVVKTQNISLKGTHNFGHLKNKQSQYNIVLIMHSD